MNDRSHRTIRVLFDERVREGSVEHYWHFMLGYFLPLHAWLFSSARDGVSGPHLLLQNSGPIMNRLLEVSLGTLGIDHEFCEDCSLHPDSGLNLPAYARQSVDPFAPLRWKENVLIPRWDLLFSNRADGLTMVNSAQRFELLQKFDFLQRKIRSAIPAPGCCDPMRISGSYLVLERSEQPEFYNQHGNAKVKGYGKGRRSLTNLEEAVAYLKEAGVKVMRYEPGAHSFGCQVRHFSSCKGVIGQRGAEFLGLFWMKPRSLAVLINQSEFSNIPPPAKLALFKKITYQQIELEPAQAGSSLMPIAQVLEVVKQHNESEL
ncbi:MAG: glycosyltransferase 61 family protein [Pseudomonadota bacterium]